ncbi:M10 family metallopeptidase C-terminal domain-containing protein [Sphingomonas sp. CFBP 13720]|nr:M10 family metallopeptidase C-terminal domain-containing protein [Sphingomonas sp. CFBP 13720]
MTYSSSKAFTGVGNALGNSITSGSGADLLQGLDGNDTLSSGSGNDTLAGGTGSDVLTGGSGGDVMAGGTGADRFVFTKVSDFGTADLLDRITDFVAADGDRIDLATIDPSSASGNQAFTFIGTEAFTTTTHTTYELRFQVAVDGYMLVQGDSNRDGVADFAFLVYTTSLGAGDFIL